MQREYYWSCEISVPIVFRTCRNEADSAAGLSPMSWERFVTYVSGLDSLCAGAGEGNRTLVCSLGSCRSTIELRPRPFL